MNIVDLMNSEKRIETAHSALEIELRSVRMRIAEIRRECGHDVQDFGSDGHERLLRCVSCLEVRREGRL